MAILNLVAHTFVGVGVVGVYDNCRVLEILFLIFFPQKTKIFVMVVRDSFSMLYLQHQEEMVCARGLPVVSTSQLL